MLGPTACGGLSRDSWPYASVRTANAGNSPTLRAVRVACMMGIAQGARQDTLTLLRHLLPAARSACRS
eukprot:6208816-Pleurochrysis_carterae.AAC.1